MIGRDRPPSTLKVRQATPAEVELLRAIDKAARTRYRGEPGLAVAVDAPAIAAERFHTGWTLVAEQDEQTLGFVLLHVIDGCLYIANIVVCEESLPTGFQAV